MSDWAGGGGRGPADHPPGHPTVYRGDYQWPTPPPSPPGWGWAAPAPLPKGGGPRTGPLPLHPMTISDVVDGAFKLFKANARSLLTITALFVVPIRVITAFLQRGIFGGQGILDVVRDPSTASAAQQNDANHQMLAVVVTIASTVLILPLVAGAVSRVVSASYVGEEMEAGPALRAAMHRFWALIGGWLVVHLVEVGGAAVALAVGVAVAFTGSTAAIVVVTAPLVMAGFVWLVVAMVLSVAVAPVIVIEEIGPFRALRRSFALLHRRFWGVLGIVVLSSLLIGLLGNILGLPLQVVGLLLGTGHGGWVLLAIGGVLSSLITTPLVAIVATLVYFDGRIRNEGFDLQMIAAEMARSGTG